MTIMISVAILHPGLGLALSKCTSATCAKWQSWTEEGDANHDCPLLVNNHETYGLIPDSRPNRRVISEFKPIQFKPI